MDLEKFRESTTAKIIDFYTKSSRKHFDKYADDWCLENIDDPLISMIKNGLDRSVATECRGELYDVAIEALENRPFALFLLADMVEEKESNGSDF